MANEFVTVAREDRVAIVTFDRGNWLNALSLQAIEELTAVALSFADDLETSAIVLRIPDGSGFSAGRDLSDPAMENRWDKPMLARRQAAGAGKRLSAAWEGLAQFTVAAVERFAIGGGLALAAALDLRGMEKGAHFRAPEVALGLSMSWGGRSRASSRLWDRRVPNRSFVSGTTGSRQPTRLPGVSCRTVRQRSAHVSSPSAPRRWPQFHYA